MKLDKDTLDRFSRTENRIKGVNNRLKEVTKAIKEAVGLPSVLKWLQQEKLTLTREIRHCNDALAYLKSRYDFAPEKELAKARKLGSYLGKPVKVEYLQFDKGTPCYLTGITVKTNIDGYWYWSGSIRYWINGRTQDKDTSIKYISPAPSNSGSK